MLAWPSLLRAVRRRGIDLVAPGAIMAAALAAIYASGLGFELERSPGYDLAGLGYIGLRTAAGWCWIVVALSMASRWLDRRPAAARTASGLVLPFYVLHHPIVVAVAAVVVPWTAGVAVEFLIILGVSLAVTLVACLAVDRSPVLRLLLGMAPARPVRVGLPSTRPLRRPRTTLTLGP
jgi:protein-S-isoprenylcysteine O-methyltransferase Ste14